MWFNLVNETGVYFSLRLPHGPRYSRMDQVKFVEENL